MDRMGSRRREMGGVCSSEDDVFISVLEKTLNQLTKRWRYGPFGPTLCNMRDKVLGCRECVKNSL
jgi:hypothetical protein